MQGICKDREELDQLTQQFSELGLEDNEELLKELDNLSMSDQQSTTASHYGKQRDEQRHLNNRIADWEQKLLDQLVDENLQEEVKENAVKPKLLLS